MVEQSQIIRASERVKKRARQTRAFERGDHVLVVPKDEQKAMRVVIFLPGGKVLCSNATTGEQCKANEFKSPCYHSLAAFNRRERNKKWRKTYRANRAKAA